MNEHLRQAWASASGPRQRFQHVFLPPDPVAAHALLVSMALRGPHNARRAVRSDQELMGALTADEDGGGGFSHHPHEGDPPAGGFMASYHPADDSDEAQVHHISAITPEHIAAHRKAIGHHLEQPNSYQGGWHDTADHNVYLDSSRHFPEESKARHFSVDQRQKAYFDLSNFDTKYVHPKLDPLAMRDEGSWHHKYADVGTEPPPGYSQYSHMYPATEEQKSFWGSRGHHLAVQGKGRWAGYPMGPWMSDVRNRERQAYEDYRGGNR